VVVADQPVIGHVHLKVSDLDRAVAFYRDALGFELQQTWGDSAAFMSFGDYHHHLGLNTWYSRGGKPPAEGSSGLFHFAILYPTRQALAQAFKRVLEHGVQMDGAADHGVSLAIYFRDPDENGIEIYWDRPREEWPFTDGQLQMGSDPIDLQTLLAEA
jgi:catechol 2,3-dioxygenase